MPVTEIEGGWVVFSDGSGHELLDGVTVVFEDDRITFGGYDFGGPADRRGTRAAVTPWSFALP